MKLYTLLIGFFLTSSVYAMESEITPQVIQQAKGLWHTKLKDWVVAIKLFAESECSKYYGDCSNLPKAKRYIIWCLGGKSLLSSLDHVVIKEAFTDDKRDSLEQVEEVDNQNNQN